MRTIVITIDRERDMAPFTSTEQVAIEEAIKHLGMWAWGSQRYSYCYIQWDRWSNTDKCERDLIAYFFDGDRYAGGKCTYVMGAVFNHKTGKYGFHS